MWVSYHLFINNYGIQIASARAVIGLRFFWILTFPQHKEEKVDLISEALILGHSNYAKWENVR